MSSTASSNSATRCSSPRGLRPRAKCWSPVISTTGRRWSPPMHRNGKAGEWTMKLPLLPGRYRYRLVVDGRWMTDPHNKYVEVNQFGELNNIVEVE